MKRQAVFELLRARGKEFSREEHNRGTWCLCRTIVTEKRGGAKASSGGTPFRKTAVREKNERNTRLNPVSGGGYTRI